VVSRLDWITLGFAGFTALLGLRRGLIGTALSFAGLVVGALVGARVGPHFLAKGNASPYAGLVALGGAALGAVALQALASLVGSFVRGGLRLMPPLRLVDSLGGLMVGAAWGLALVWVAAAVALQLPAHSQLRRDVRHSEVVQRLNRLAPPRDVLRLRAQLPGFLTAYASSSSTAVGLRYGATT
jgi:uncharacterized membrane protein required for colicin V production